MSSKAFKSDHHVDNDEPNENPFSCRGEDCLSWRDKIPDFIKQRQYKVTHDADKESENWFTCPREGCLTTRRYRGMEGLQKHYLENHSDQNQSLEFPEVKRESTKSVDDDDYEKASTASNTVDTTPLAGPSRFLKSRDLIKCQICNKSFEFKYILTFHMKKEHGPISASDTTTMRQPVKDAKKGLPVNSKSDPSRNDACQTDAVGMEMENRRCKYPISSCVVGTICQHMCPDCPFQGQHSSVVKHHLRLHKKGVNTVVCGQCGWFVATNGLEMHTIRRHGKAKNPSQG